MQNDRWERIKQLFTAALEASGEDREALLDRECAGDPQLRREVESLLAAQSPDVMDTGGAARAVRVKPDGGAPVEPDAANAKDQYRNLRTDDITTVESPKRTEVVGTRIGPYKLLQLIGEGGFGYVYMADQEHLVRRRVALKIIKLGMDTKQVIARFEQERQALALMDHPNIARVLDAGATESGSPYFVMEYVKGDPITKFADAHRLDFKARLNLFMQVCLAVQHAHTKGIIHRDIKPSNVLANMTDGKPFAKVIDFGIAKATGARLTEKTLFTEHRQLVGTPEYMSPEQAEGSPDIDTRTDVYALGVMLYELLTGVTPFDAARLRSAAFAEMQRIIKEEEPLIPSVRLSRSLETLALTAAARQIEPAKLGTAIKGELDWIVMKALDKERGRRYETASAMAQDVERHLTGKPVVAAPRSAAYQFVKLMKRHWVGTVVAAATLLAGIGTSTGMILALQAKAKLESQYDFAGKSTEAILAVMDGREEDPNLVYVRSQNSIMEIGLEESDRLKHLSAVAIETAGRVNSANIELELSNHQLRAQYDAAIATLKVVLASLDSLNPGDRPTVRRLKLSDGTQVMMALSEPGNPKCEVLFFESEDAVRLWSADEYVPKTQITPNKLIDALRVAVGIVSSELSGENARLREAARRARLGESNSKLSKLKILFANKHDNFESNMAEFRAAIATRDELLGLQDVDTARKIWEFGMMMREYDEDSAAIEFMMEAIQRHESMPPLGEMLTYCCHLAEFAHGMHDDELFAEALDRIPNALRSLPSREIVEVWNGGPKWVNAEVGSDRVQQAVTCLLAFGNHEIGRHEIALSSALSLANLRAKDGMRPNPGNLAIIAISHWESKQHDSARASLAQLRTLMKDPEWHDGISSSSDFYDDDEMEALAAEAESLITDFHDSNQPPPSQHVPQE